MDSLMTTGQIRKEARERGLDSAIKLHRETGVSLATCHKILKSEGDEAVCHESTLRTITDYFRQTEALPEAG